MIGVILAGGKGSRLISVTKDEIPKPLAKIYGKPIIEHCINQLKQFGIQELYITVGHLHEKIENYLGNGDRLGVSIHYIVEGAPLGSGGALYYLKEKVTDDLVICSGDVIFSLDINKIHEYHKSKDALITLVTHPNAHPYDSDLIVTDSNGRVTAIDKKGKTRAYYYKNNVNAGFLIAKSETLSYFDCAKQVNLEHDYVNHFVQSGRVFAYSTPEYIRDVGTEERFCMAEKDLASGLVEQKNLKNRQKAIFLDRDGVINKYKGFITKSEDIELIDFVSEAIRKINKSHYMCIIVSNQPVIARGECSFDEVEKMFDKIETLLGQDGAYIDARYYCPHHPHSGYVGEVKELKIDCNCRKPKIGMLLKAANDFNLDLTSCFMIGDANIDILTGKNAGITTIRVNTGITEENIEPSDYNVNNLMDAVNVILGE